MPDISAQLGNTDIYLLDQILKGRYRSSERILDAGAGMGRNLHWFVGQGFAVYGVDRNRETIAGLKEQYPGVPLAHFQVAGVEAMPFPDAHFHHVISSAVLHFADSHAHFEQMFAEMIRVLKPGGSLFIRMTTDVGLSGGMTALGQGRFSLRDGSDRYLLSRQVLHGLLLKYKLQLLEPFKTVLVEDLRSMAVLMLQKKA